MVSAKPQFKGECARRHLAAVAFRRSWFDLNAESASRIGQVVHAVGQFLAGSLRSKRVVVTGASPTCGPGTEAQSTKELVSRLLDRLLTTWSPLSRALR